MEEVEEPLEGVSNAPVRFNSILRVAGFAFNRAWVFAVFFSGVLFKGFSPDLQSAVVGRVYSSSITVLAIALVLLGVFHGRVLRASAWKLFNYAGPIITAAGIIVLAAPMVVGETPSTFVIWASALGTGVGSALTLIYLGRYYSAVESKECVSNVLWASAFAALLALLVMQLPWVTATAVIVLLPFFSVGTISLINVKLEISQSDEQRFSGEKISTRMLLRLAVCAAVLGMLTGMLHELFIVTASAEVAVSFQYGTLAMGAAAPLALILILRWDKSSGIEALYRPTVFLATVGFALLPVVGFNIVIPYLVVDAGYMLFEVLIWVILSEMAHRFQYTSVQVFGFGRALTLVFGVIAGGVVANLGFSGPAGFPNLGVISAASIIAISFTRSYVLTTSHLVELEHDLSDDGTAYTPEPQIGNGTERAETLEEIAPSTKIPLKRRCTIIGQYYGLTAREIDVFHLLAIGRNSARIQEELVVSAGTVNTHTRHVFQKLGVHAQQELIDLFEKADLDMMQAQWESREQKG